MKDLYLKNGDLKNYPRLFEDIFHIESTLYKYEENEEIVEKALKGQKAKIVPIEFEGKDTLPLLPTKIEGTLCVRPTKIYEGFFIAKIRKEK